MNAKAKTAAEQAKEAFSECCHAIARDMPLIMHGSGDVPPHQVNPESVKLLCELTVNYISNLVDAAIDTHEIINDGPQPLPPPPLPNMDHRKPPLPAPYVPPTPSPGGANSSTTATGTTATSSSSTSAVTPGGAAGTTTTSTSAKPLGSTITLPSSRKRQRRRSTDEFWDEPLPEPNIKGKPRPDQKSGTTASTADSASLMVHGVHIDHWVGVAGADFREQARSRRVHIGGPKAIGTQCFTFPICHDTGLYGKVMDVLKARQSIEPVLIHPVVMDLIHTDGAPARGGSVARKRVKAPEDDPEEEDSAASEADEGAAWPGLEYLLPVYATDDFIKDLATEKE